MPAFAGMTTFLYGEKDRINGNMTLEEILAWSLSSAGGGGGWMFFPFQL